MTATLLLTSVGSLVGQNVLDSLEGRRQALRIVATNSVAEAGNNRGEHQRHGERRHDDEYALPEGSPAHWWPCPW